MDDEPLPVGGADAALVQQRDAVADGVVWLTIISSAPGTQGHVEGEEARQWKARTNGAATHLLLDNMGQAALREAVAQVAGRVATEASGGITLETIHAAAATGVTYVSVGRITQSAPAVDIGLDLALG